MRIECDITKCTKAARWLALDMSDTDGYDRHGNYFPIREGYLFCGEHIRGISNIYRVPLDFHKHVCVVE